MTEDLTLNMNAYLPLRDVVFNTLREAILKGELKPGERLMELQLAAKLGVSRTPIREAIRMLEQEGLAVTIPRKGAEVARMTEKDMEDVLQIRDALDELAASIACEQISEEELAELRHTMHEFEESTKTGDVKRIAEADVRFHDIIYHATRNVKLENMLNNLREQMYRYRVEYLKDEKNFPILIREHSQGLICLSACLSGDLPKLLLQDRHEDAVAYVREMQDIFGKENFFIEIMDHGIREERIVLLRLAALARELDVPLVATNDCHYLEEKDADAQEVLMCIQTGKTLEDSSRMRMETRQLYVKSEAEMRALFSPPTPTPWTTPGKSPSAVRWSLSSGSPACPAIPCPRRKPPPRCWSGCAGRAWPASTPTPGKRTSPTAACATSWTPSATWAMWTTSSSCGTSSTTPRARASWWGRGGAAAPAPSWPIPWASPCWTP